MVGAGCSCIAIPSPQISKSVMILNHFILNTPVVFSSPNMWFHHVSSCPSPTSTMGVFKGWTSDPMGWHKLDSFSHTTGDFKHVFFSNLGMVGFFWCFNDVYPNVIQQRFQHPWVSNMLSKIRKSNWPFFFSDRIGQNHQPESRSVGSQLARSCTGLKMAQRVRIVAI